MLRFFITLFLSNKTNAFFPHIQSSSLTLCRALRLLFAIFRFLNVFGTVVSSSSKLLMIFSLNSRGGGCASDVIVGTYWNSCFETGNWRSTCFSSLKETKNRKFLYEHSYGKYMPMYRNKYLHMNHCLPFAVRLRR